MLSSRKCRTIIRYLSNDKRKRKVINNSRHYKSVMPAIILSVYQSNTILNLSKRLVVQRSQPSYL